MRRYVAETKVSGDRGESLQKVTIYPVEINRKQLDKQLGSLTANLGMLIKSPNGWDYEEIK